MAQETYLVLNTLLMGKVENEFGEICLGVVGLDAVCLRKALREDLGDVRSLKVCDLGHVTLATKQLI